jgi:hypothetical protein
MSSPAKVVAKAPAKKPAAKKVEPVHPTFADMVIAAVIACKQRKGVSLQAIKKYIIATYNGIDAEKCGVHIKKAVKGLVVASKLNQKTGTGASGSFTLGVVTKPKAAPKKKPAVKKPAKKVKKPAAKKPAAKKAAAKKPAAKKPAAKKPAAKKPAAKKPAAKKAAAKKPVAKKTTKKTAAKKTAKK